jgi:trans-2,3-dihydro-3-hydroxyanthranilate isomerase
MTDYDMVQVDAFTDTPLRGNACAILPQADGLDSETMQAIAREMNLSETSFVLPSQVADFRCRYFTPAEEIPLAGHPTIATVHALVELGLIDADQRWVSLELPAGVISIERRQQDSGGTLYVMTQLKPEFGRRINRSELATVLRVPENSVRPDLPVQIVSTGTPQLMVPLMSLTALKNANPDAGRVLELRERAKFFSLHAFTEETLEEASTAHSRHWAPAASGLFEDPVTGSASGGMAAYLLQYELVKPGTLRFEQGDFMQRPGRVHAEVEFASEGVVGPPRIGGEAVLVMQGTIRI